MPAASRCYARSALTGALVHSHMCPHLVDMLEHRHQVGLVAQLSSRSTPASTSAARVVVGVA